MNKLAERLRKSWKAALIHLSVSAFLAIGSTVVVFGFWYPGELSTAQGVGRIVLVMIVVDVILGPLLTAIVFDRDKRGVYFDMSIIVLARFAALTYALLTIHSGRPMYVVFNVDRFDVVTHQNIDRESLEIVPIGLEPDRWAPRFVGARLPQDPKRRDALLFSSLEGGPDLPQLPEYYVPLESESPTMLNKLHPMDELKALNKIGDEAWNDLIERLGDEEKDMGYLPMVANARDGVVVLDRRSAKIIGIRMLIPRYGAPQLPTEEAPAPAVSPRALQH